MTISADVITLAGALAAMLTAVSMGVRRAQTDRVAQRAAEQADHFRHIVEQTEKLKRRYDELEQAFTTAPETAAKGAVMITAAQRGAIMITAAQHAEYRRKVDLALALQREIAGCEARERTRLAQNPPDLLNSEAARITNCQRSLAKVQGELKAMVADFGVQQPSDAYELLTKPPSAGSRSALQTNWVDGSVSAHVERVAAAAGKYDAEPARPCLEGHTHTAVPVDGLPEHVDPRWLCEHCFTDVDAAARPVASPLAIDEPAPRQIRQKP